MNHSSFHHRALSRWQSDGMKLTRVTVTSHNGAPYLRRRLRRQHSAQYLSYTCCQISAPTGQRTCIPVSLLWEKKKKVWWERQMQKVAAYMLKTRFFTISNCLKLKTLTACCCPAMPDIQTEVPTSFLPGNVWNWPLAFLSCSDTARECAGSPGWPRSQRSGSRHVCSWWSPSSSPGCPRSPICPGGPRSPCRSRPA